MLHPRDLRIFCKVADTGNMSRVAQAEAKSVMAISKQIGRLEAELNQALFIRSRRTLVLTEFGQQFKLKTERLLEHYQSLVDWGQNNENTVSGELRVVCQSNEIIRETLVPWLAEFVQLYPNLGITLDVKEGLVDILEDDFDIFWAIGPYLGQRYSGLKQKSLWKSAYGLFASPDYLRNAGIPATIEDLKQHKVIGYSHNQPTNVLVARGDDGQPHFINAQCQIKTVTGLQELAEAGLGIINAPADTATIRQLVAEKRLQPILEEHWWEGAEVYAYYHPSRPIQPKVRAFLDFFAAKRSEWCF
ncbi:LysR family transcriptional regulator [Glaciecola sp. XM2]|jgi:DNA-binding transcriptional LysR family regulator|uniref:LysR family transcriptional regulator n=1 Tax=Glaciecola sp. XM2 TaxID=1914931 RepID=UPI001BDDCF02|nr:LysR family transcriptional regulator [Glaciecola sp. XM2]MBT1451306.1 LysR family transcriptional regulator [Glaciecola sp. XM2]